jgi:uncharacterized membrane protein YcjF (UPF0283 family)
MEQGSAGAFVLAQLETGQGSEAIENMLLEQGHDIQFVKQVVAEAQKLYYTKRRAQGMTMILVGAVICLLSCVLTLTASFTTNTFPYILYGATSVGILVVFAGLMKVF